MNIAEVWRIQRTSKNGNSYQVLCVLFENGYVLEKFLDNKEVYILKDVPLR